MTHCRVILARPRGFCAGVVRAVDIVERALALYGAPVYVRHEIVHNRHVVDSLKKLGAVFVEATEDVPEGAVTVFSAHGVSKTVEGEARARHLDVIDATCPLVRRVHKEAQAYARDGYDVVLVGHDGHAEVEGTRGQIPGPVQIVATVGDVAGLAVRDPARVAYVTQTTLSLFDTQDIIAALRARFPDIKGPDTRDICYATQNRQLAVMELAEHAQLVLVVGSANSSNANRLQELAQSMGVPSYLIDQPSGIDPAWLDGVSVIGVTAGASTPESVVQDVVGELARHRAITVETMEGKEEHVRFRLPDRLQAPARANETGHDAAHDMSVHAS
ncbi:MAG: 4-hydroxy-3-methylbut-2-enyl diphosphate reductase [Hyphomicrobium sp.]